MVVIVGIDGIRAHMRLHLRELSIVEVVMCERTLNGATVRCAGVDIIYLAMAVRVYGPWITWGWVEVLHGALTSKSLLSILEILLVGGIIEVQVQKLIIPNS